MKEELITFETAKLAKEKGFDVYCYNYWIDDKTQTDEHYKSKLVKELKDKCISAPTQSLLQKWLREVHNIDVYCQPTFEIKGKWYNNIASHNPPFVGTYEEALEIGLQEALKLIP